jgi:4-hydroxy-2-oxoheptanedioate aldolase
MRHNTVKHACLQGRVQVGSWNLTNDPLCAQIMAQSGYGWVLVDMEHGPVPITALQHAVNAIRTTTAQPFARAAWNASASIQPILDCGVSGILVPMVSNRAQAEAVVRDTRYLPLGERSRGPMRAAASFETDSAAYCAAANDEVLVMVQIETVEAMTNLDDIASIEGIDSVFVGPNDLASSYGLEFPASWADKNSAYFRAIADLPKVARKRGKIPGIQIFSPAQANEVIALGYTLVAIGSDAGFLREMARNVRAQVNDER